jgi:subtilisin family serine protease
MSPIFSRIVLLLWLGFSSQIVFAQSPTDSIVHFQSGDFLPVRNYKDVAANSSKLASALHQGKYYVVIQFERIPDQDVRAVLKSQGVELVDYIPSNAYTATIPATVNWLMLSNIKIRSVFSLSAKQKVSNLLYQDKVPAHAQQQAGYIDLSIITFDRMQASAIFSTLSNQGVTILEELPAFKSFIVRVPVSQVRNFIELPFILWADFIDEPNKEENLPGRTQHRVNVLSDGPRDLQGDGVNVGIWDGGAIGSHLDFFPIGRVTQVENVGSSAHSTHCAGTILGRGLIDPFARGMAPNAQLFSYDFNGNVPNEIAAAIPTYSLSVSSHSYGGSATCGVNGSSIAYSGTSRATDLNLNNFPTHLHVHSAGNSQSSCPGGWYTITGSGKSAKNNILVAALTSTDAMTSFSSFGPVQDGRVKPDISSMGNNVFSTTTPANSYTFMSGTSMATPGVAGSVSLLVQRFRQLNSNANPPSALIKNAVLNSAQDLGNVGPDYKFGYGRIDVLEAARVLEQNRYAVNNIGNGATQEITITVPTGATRLNVMLVWNDPAGTANAATPLVNNLDLTVVNGSTTNLPWVLDKNNPGNPATAGVDVVSNVEQVTINAPAAGVYTVRVTGSAVTTATNQEYTLTWTIDQPRLEITYPNGGENLAPGTSELITWNNLGMTGAYTIEYSLNNGVTWNPIVSSLSPTATRYNWTVPTGVQSRLALVRISSGTYIDQSDAVFHIMGPVTGLTGDGNSCAAGEVNLSWNPVADATAYDILRLDPLTGQFVLEAAVGNVAGYTVTGLTPGASVWFSVRARSSIGSISRRANAINVTVSNGGGSMGSPGAISGANTVCNTAIQYTYSIASVNGASSYVWTVPAGAAILSGQSTSSISVLFTSGNQSGDIAVYATNGSCQTPSVRIAVAVGNANLVAPTSGGNQTVQVCPGASIPRLTASATTTPGSAVVWYNASSGGVVVPDPFLNTIGSVTYYAAAKEIATGCESASRTSVQLQLVAVPAASITANGPVTFCQGGNVVLTATGGASYLWSNGATASSVTISNSTSLTVTVTTGNCVSTAPAVQVTVNPLPAATITALTPTTVCDGDRVLLAASTGTGWSWTNGATTQSILVGAAGSYQVTVTNTFGCSSISSATTVAVEPNPVVTLTASPYLKIYPGLRTALNANVTPTGNYAYTWQLNSQTIPGELTAQLDSIGLKHPSGSYAITVQNLPPKLPCASTSAPFVIGDSVTAQLFVFPSPTQGQFRVSYYSASADQYSISIYDAKGSNVYRRSYTIASRYQLLDVDLRTAANGIYLIRLTDRANRVLATGKVVIAH